MNLQIFPKRQLSYRTTLTAAEVLGRLETHLRQVKTGDTHLPADTFVGEIKGDSFYIHERIGYRGNSFTPGIKGRVEHDEQGTIVHIDMHLGGCVRVFILVWCYLPLLLLFLSVVGFIRDGEIPHFTILLVIVVPLLFMYFMMKYGFKSGSETARIFIATTFEGVEMVDNETFTKS